MPLLRQERQGRSLAQHHPGRELIGRLRHERAIVAQKLGRIREGMDQQTRENLRPKCMQPEFEARDDPEIAAAATERPEQVRILRLAGATDLAIGRDDICANQIVDRHAELSRGPAEATAQREPGNSRRRVDAHRSRQTKGLSFAIEVSERCARLDPRNSSPLDQPVPIALERDRSAKLHRRRLFPRCCVLHHGRQRAVRAGEQSASLE